MSGRPKKYKSAYIPPDVVEDLDYIKRIEEQKIGEVIIYDPTLRVTFPNLLRKITRSYIENEKKKRSQEQ